MTKYVFIVKKERQDKILGIYSNKDKALVQVGKLNFSDVNGDYYFEQVELDSNIETKNNFKVIEGFRLKYVFNSLTKENVEDLLESIEPLTIYCPIGFSYQVLQEGDNIILTSSNKENIEKFINKNLES